MSEAMDLLSLLGEEDSNQIQSSDSIVATAPAMEAEPDPEGTTKKLPAKADPDPASVAKKRPCVKRSRKRSTSVVTDPVPSQALVPSSCPAETGMIHSEDDIWPVLPDSAAVRERAVAILHRIDPALVESVTAELPFPPEDDPFTRTLEGWEAEWYGTRESALRVYLTLRIEFLRQLGRAIRGEANDLKPWTLWVFRGSRPDPTEPVHGLPPERRRELGWDYDGPAADFRIYGTSEASME